jgi:tricorn protease
MKAKMMIGLILILASFSAVFASPQEARVLRFPAISQDQIVFTWAGDLYAVPLKGGIARKLTSHAGYEMFARFSPDGKFLAFTGEYDGNREVYLMPAEGGIPKRLTYTPLLSRDDVSDRMGPNNIVMGWKNDNKHIVFRSRMRSWNPFLGQLYLAAVGGGTPEQLPLPRGGFCSFSPDGNQLAYNRVFREFRTWKRYRGGMADDIWIYDFATRKTENITNNPALDIIPMWKGERIYFLSDRNEKERLNIYSYDLRTKETRQLTNFADFDIKFPSLGPGAIVFENGGYIYRFDLASEKTEKVPILIADDMASGRSKIVKVSEMVTNYEISPDGKRALFGARGEVFTVPAQFGNTRNLTNSSGIHERNSKWSPDGRWIAFISDRSGEDEIYLIAQDGQGNPQQLTKNADTYKYQIYWSPDSKKILWGDKKLRLNYVDIEKKEVVEVARAEAWEITQYCWSPDSRWIAYAKPEVEEINKIYIYSLEAKKSFEVTDNWYSSSEPCFSSDGKYLFFVSDRDFRPVYSSTEFNHAYLSMSRIYFVTLAADTKSPFEPKSDEVSLKAQSVPEKESGAKAAKDDKAQAAGQESVEKKELPVRVDTEGLAQRIIGLPIEVARYWQISSVGDKIYYMKRGDRDTRSSLKMYDLAEQKETDLGNIGGYELSADQKKMLVSQDQSFAIIDAPKTPIKIETKLTLSQMEMALDLRQEWDQIFDECWRQMKYFFYDPNMHGVDWNAMKERYEPLAKAVNNRADLTYVIGELIGELNAGHTYVGGGDLPAVNRVPVGMLGALFEREPQTKFYKIKKILKGQNWNATLKSPLTEIGVNIREGEYIIAVNGRRTDDLTDISEALLNTVGKQIRLTVNTKPEESGSREVVVVPIQDESPLFYFTWVQENIEKVSKATGGNVGYIHIPDMSAAGLNEFVKYFYPQLRKKALIIDVRGNGGGSVSPMIIERLAREMVMVDMARNVIPSADPSAVMLGPKVCLIDEFSASDGDIFPYRFNKMNLGKLIGKRTWGGVIGIRGTLPLVDGGYLNKPEFATYSTEGKWIIEGHGVEPDIYVDNDPAQEYAGNDQQLNKAIEVILEELKTKGKDLPPVPPFPKKIR